MEIMHQLNIDILTLQKIKVNFCREEFKTIEGTDKVYKFFFSSDKNVPNPSAALQARPQAKANPRNFSEHHGVGFVMGPKLGNVVSDCIPHNGRIIELHIRNPGPNIRIINHYAPHSARPFAKKNHHWNLLHSTIPKHKPPTCRLSWWEAPTHACMEDSADWKKRWLVVMFLVGDYFL